MLASIQGHVGVVKVLLNSGANMHLRNNNSKTALELALSNDREDVAIELRRERD